MIILGWIPLIIFYVFWLKRKKPHRRTIVYEFLLSKFSITVKRW
ncbi:MAG: hypothetical protein JWP12_2160 [Bacteroidetes bacterium]|nr:hypothetical protein [Bacteroidota bacterium]